MSGAQRRTQEAHSDDRPIARAVAATLEFVVQRISPFSKFLTFLEVRVMRMRCTDGPCPSSTPSFAVGFDAIYKVLTIIV